MKFLAGTCFDALLGLVRKPTNVPSSTVSSKSGSQPRASTTLWRNNIHTSLMRLFVTIVVTRLLLTLGIFALDVALFSQIKAIENKDAVLFTTKLFWIINLLGASITEPATLHSIVTKKYNAEELKECLLATKYATFYHVVLMPVATYSFVRQSHMWRATCDESQSCEDIYPWDSDGSTWYVLVLTTTTLKVIYSFALGIRMSTNYFLLGDSEKDRSRVVSSLMILWPLIAPSIIVAPILGLLRYKNLLERSPISSIVIERFFFVGVFFCGVLLLYGLYWCCKDTCRKDSTSLYLETKAWNCWTAKHQQRMNEENKVKVNWIENWIHKTKQKALSTIAYSTVKIV